MRLGVHRVASLGAGRLEIDEVLALEGLTFGLGGRRLAGRGDRFAPILVLYRGGGCFAGGLARRAATLLRLGALEQRIALELGLDEAGQLDIGELQQLDGLLQLRRHDQIVGLTELELCVDRHYRTHSRSAAQILNWSPR